MQHSSTAQEITHYNLKSQSVIMLHHWFQISPGRNSQTLNEMRVEQEGEASQNEVNNTRRESEINLERPSTLKSRDVNASFEGQVQGQCLQGNVQITCMESTSGGKKSCISVQLK